MGWHDFLGVAYAQGERDRDGVDDLFCLDGEAAQALVVLSGSAA